MSSDESPQIPQKGRPSKADLDQREAELDARETNILDEERALQEETERLNTAQNQLIDSVTLPSEPGHPPRVSIDESVAKHGKGENSKAIRSEIESGKKFPNIDRVLEKHQDKKFLWINELNGDVQRWIDIGAEPVPIMTNTRKSFEGITDKSESQWIRAVGGETGAGVMWVYLLMIDPEVYHRVKIAPQMARQELIRRAMTAGRSGDVEDKNLPSYAPNLPTGGVGFEEMRETVGK